MKLRWSAALLTLLLGTAAAAYRVYAGATPAPPAELSAYLPQDAMLSIESPDFAGLLHRWTGSPESHAWLASSNYAVFQNSRLFGQLSDAQTSFAAAAGVPAGVDLLQQVAGGRSAFAWYDIGKLEFLYITRLPAAQADRSQLLQARGSFERRHAGKADFYIRSSGAEHGTVAFAQTADAGGDLLLLATREDLIANALKSIAGQKDTGTLRDEPWFHDAVAALPAETPAPALHMVLNLDRISHDPHFETYWIQRNVTWVRQFRSAAADLYVEAGRFREERALVRQTAVTPPADPGLAALASLAPADAGLVRASASGDAAAAAATLGEKLLGSASLPAATGSSAPDPDLSTPSAGYAEDLEVRIDATPVPSSSASLRPLQAAIGSAGLDAVMTVGSVTGGADAGSAWVHTHAAMALHSVRAWDAAGISTALQAALGSRLTAGELGTRFRTESSVGGTLYVLDGPKPLLFAVSSTPAYGHLLLLADQRALMLALLANVAKPPPTSEGPVSMLASFRHATLREPSQHLFAFLDAAKTAGGDHGGTADAGDQADGAAGADAETGGSSADQAEADSSDNPATQTAGPVPGDATTPAAPSFLSNVGSLSDVFQQLKSEQIVERPTETVLRQSVVYVW